MKKDMKNFREKVKLCVREADVLDLYIAEMPPIINPYNPRNLPPARDRTGLVVVDEYELKKNKKAQAFMEDNKVNNANKLLTISQNNHDWQDLIADKAKMIEMHAF